VLYFPELMAKLKKAAMEGKTGDDSSEEEGEQLSDSEPAS
jgi:hypothetical protein